MEMPEKELHVNITDTSNMQLLQQAHHAKRQMRQVHVPGMRHCSYLEMRELPRCSKNLHL